MTLSVPPWSMSMIWPVPELPTSEMVSVPTLPPLSAMSAPLVLPMSRPETLLFWATLTPSPAVASMVGRSGPDATPVRVWPLSRLMPSASA